MSIGVVDILGGVITPNWKWADPEEGKMPTLEER